VYWISPRLMSKVFGVVLIWVTKVGDGAGGGDGMAKWNWWRDERMLLEYGMKLKRKKEKRKVKKHYFNI
jgi:hypothetical protein